MPASAELVDLCQAHLELLHRTFGDISSVIYLTLGVDAESEPILVPIAQVPEFADLNELLNPMIQRGALPASGMTIDTLSAGKLTDTTRSNPDINSAVERLVLPLIHQEIVLGVLVILRSDRPWQASERQYLQTMSVSLAVGCFLDQQNQWLHQRLKSKQTLQGEQSEVFHNLLHQFRNPLTAIGTFGKLMLRRLSQEDPNYRLADGIVRESQRLKELVTDFDAAVDIGDADIGKAINPPLLPESNSTTEHKPLLPALGRSLELTPQFLGNVLEPLITVTVAAASERHRKFWHSPLNSFSQALVTIDAQALQEVVANLLDNAFKYAPSHSWVWLLGELTRENYSGIVVGDSGPGIPTADQARLFERNYRGVQAQGNIAGTGLGLAIAKDLITQMGGKIELISPLMVGASQPPWLPVPLHQYLEPMDSIGTVFIIWLPTTHH
ncbi:GAF domain-containing sensor histidine kinase [Leptothoe spongobia]|uniref:histidine kinase n=1 Tax=Leptothoe spongobia TAU-MAC 1115 TaxID=1967444 RepID=A0A947DGV0_9CYAN|nr:ATP-binding protein [Leptothoe spongobia]MBT9316414.1 GAF domain-containing protein [Leptothoe spongobia TAU-MAC 1115]